ncbi:B-cell receptor-associated protein 29 like protein [Argiope bruennichi]|uniref:Endoplasmic reticulum transmembrane protein n=1 Tax=Argiope bruennichi TaxID=94029 RepID=A0A8T0E660_ARGBR|nr:B-cell receptor-associated protein 29 like protein [Argiope bruennichi]
MTIQWTLIASFLYLELFIIILLILPFISARIWKYILRFHLWEAIGEKANTYFMVFLMVLVLFLLDSVREMVKYTGKHPHDYEVELQTNMKLYRSQRNYYIAGMALFFSLVIRRLAMLILAEYDLISKIEEAMKKALKATEDLGKIMREDKLEEQKNPSSGKFIEEIKGLENLLEFKANELKSSEQNLEVLKMRSTEISEKCKEILEEIGKLKAKTES